MSFRLQGVVTNKTVGTLIHEQLHATKHAVDNEAAELQCICRAPNAGTLVPTCEACVAEFDQDDTDTDDVSADENATLYHSLSFQQLFANMMQIS
jgi:hypothetical protein